MATSWRKRSTRRWPASGWTRPFSGSMWGVPNIASMTRPNSTHGLHICMQRVLGSTDGGRGWVVEDIVRWREERKEILRRGRWRKEHNRALELSRAQNFPWNSYSKTLTPFWILFTNFQTFRHFSAFMDALILSKAFAVWQPFCVDSNEKHV